MVEVGKDMWRLSGLTPVPSQGHLELVSQKQVQMAFEYLQGWRLHNIPGQFMPVLIHPHRVFPVFQFVPVVSGPIPGNHWEESGSLFLHLPFRYSYTLMRFPLSFFFSRLKSPSSLSLSLYRERCSNPLIIFMALHWTSSTMYWNDSSKCNPGTIAQKMLTTVHLSCSHMREWALAILYPMWCLKEGLESWVKDLYWLALVSHTKRKKKIAALLFTVPSNTWCWLGAKLLLRVFEQTYH